MSGPSFGQPSHSDCTPTADPYADPDANPSADPSADPDAPETRFGMVPSCTHLCTPRPHAMLGQKLLDSLMRRRGHPNTHWAQLIAQRLGNSR